MNHLVPDVQMSPTLIKCSSDSSIENDESYYNDIEQVIDKLMNDICYTFESPKREIYKYVKVLQNQRIIYMLMNMIYYIFSKYNFIEYQKIFNVKTIFCTIDTKFFQLKSSRISVFDNCFQLNKKLKIPYEYVKSVSNENDYIILNLIPNERNITKIYIQTNNNANLYKKIYTNMQYHVRYHKLNQNAIKYYQKFNPTPLEVY